MPSAAFLRSLPSPALMRRRLRTFAMLDTIVAPTARSFEWHPRWNGRHQQAGGFKDGEGNFFFAWFCPRGAVVRGFDHESKISPYRKDPPEIWPGMFRGLPKSLAWAMDEPSLAIDETTFCFWAAGSSSDWIAGATASDDIDGAASLLGCLRTNFKTWVDAFYGSDLDENALGRLLWSQPLDWETVERLNVDFDERAVREEAELLDWELDLSHGDPHVAMSRPPPLRIATTELTDLIGATEFIVRCEPSGVVLSVGDRVVARSEEEDVYTELLELVRSRLTRH